MTVHRRQRRVVIAVAAIAPLLVACGSAAHHVAATSATASSATPSSATPSSASPSSASPTGAVSPSASGAAPIDLAALGAPTVSAACGGGSYRQAAAASPLHGIATSAATGFELTGSNCDTSFTWKLGRGYARFTATVFPSMSDSGPVSVAFAGDGHPLSFTAGGAAATSVRVSSPLIVSVETGGVASLTITLPNSGQDAGVLDFTDATLVP
jgi:hypothetical protein